MTGITIDMRKFSVFARAGLLGLLLAAPAAASAAGRVPGLEGASIRVDFGPRFIEAWRAEPPSDFAEVVIPHRPAAAWPAAAAPAAWEGAPLLGPLQYSEPRTEFQAFFSDDTLFFRARNWFDPDHPPIAEMRERDRWVGGEDLVEIRLRVPPPRAGQGSFGSRALTENPVYHFIVNAAGAIYDSKNNRTEYDPEWATRVEILEDNWSAFIAIPFAALELDGPVPALEINIGRDGVRAPVISWGPEWSGTVNRRIILEGVSGPAAAEAVFEERPGAEESEIAGGSYGRGVSLDWVSGRARPQDRWIEGTVRIEDEFARGGHELEIRLVEPGLDEPREIARVRPEGVSGRLLVDLRRHGLEKAVVEARLYGPERLVGLAVSHLGADPLPPMPGYGFRVPLLVDLPDGPGRGGDWPFSFGVPFPAGLLWEASGWLVEDDTGRAWPTQLEISGRWALDGSVQWLRVDTVTDPRRELFLVRRPGAEPPAPAIEARAQFSEGQVLVSNGLAEYVISPGHSPIMSAWRDGRLIAGAGNARGLYLVDQDGRLATASAEGAVITVEADGPVAVCVRVEGDYRTAGGESLARHITRVEISAGQPFAAVTHTLVLTRDTNETWFREVGWELELAEGAGAEAFFGVSREDPSAFRRVVPDGETYLVQESYYRFGAGEKRFRLAGPTGEILAGEEMGDWFLAQNDAAGVAWSCRDSARQHPKEFLVSGRLVNLRLFSPRAGEELDFRSPALVERWNLRNWYAADRWEELSEDRRAAISRKVDNVRGIGSSAVGWAKTHHLLFSPAPGPREAGEAAALSAWHSREPFILPDPAWINRSRAMGPLHPRDPERFPEAERLVDEALDFFSSRVSVSGDWGFVDYWGGPQLRHENRKYPIPVRWGLTYTLRPDAWRVFARSGRRDARDFATLTNRAFGDNHLCSWGDGTRTRGLYTVSTGGEGPSSAASLPFYWGHRTETNRSSSTNLDQFLFDYHLAGYRRAGDLVRDFAEGLREQLTPSAMERDWRILMTTRVLLQCYGFTWEDDLLELAREATSRFIDPEGAIGLTKDRPYRSSTYKTNVDIRALLDAWRITGDPLYRRLSRSVAEHLWQSYLGGQPISYTNPQGIVGHFLWEETRNPMIAQALLLQARWMSAHHAPDSSGHGVALGAHEAAPVFEGLPAMLDVVSRAGTDRRSAASWAAVRDFENPVDFAFFKPDNETVRFSLKTPSALRGAEMAPLTPSTYFGLEALRGSLGRTGYTRWTAPLDVPEIALRVTPGSFGTHYGLAWGRQPLVLHAPGYWVPWPPQSPPARWHFRVPEDAAGPAIFFEGRARVYDPDGEPWRESGPVSEWLELPAEKPGLWSFEVLEPRLVRARNLPPFFAAENPESWFDPGIEWERETGEPEPFEPPAATGFVDGLSGLPEDRALFVSARGSFGFEGGETRPEEGRGTQFLPFHEGTIEFWLRPAWGTFDDWPRDRANSQPILQMRTDRDAWLLSYQMNYADRSDLWLYNLYAQAFAGEGAQRRTFRNWRKFTLFERGQWVHIALCWGQQVRNTAEGPRETLTIVAYFNGRAGDRQHHEITGRDARPADLPRRLVFPRLRGAIDHLRVSDIIRYAGDFEPSRQAPSVDRHTRAYFAFDGSLEGISGDGRAVTGEIE